MAGGIDETIATMLQIHIDKTGERWIAILTTLCQKVAEESSVIIVNHLMNDGNIRAFRLEDDQSATASTTCTATDLRHHHKGMLVGTEVGIIEHRVSIEDAHHGYTVEVETLGDHLGANKDVGAPRREIVDNAFVSLTGTGGVKIHAGDTSLREDGAHFVFDFLRSIATRLKFTTATSRALGRHLISIAAVMTSKLIEVAMKGQRHITMLTMRYPTTLFTLNHRSIAATVLEKDSLFATFKGLAYL